MRPKKRFNPHDRAVANVDALTVWLSETALDAIPLNQFGLASRQKICAQLGISRSTISTNAELRRLFEKLDEKITEAASEASRLAQAARSNLERSRPAEINQLLADISQRNEELERRLHVLAYLEDTGWDIRP